MASVQLNVRISSEESDHLEELAQQTEGILSKQGVVRLLIQHAQRSGWNPLDTPVTLDRRAAASLSKSSSSTSKKKKSLSIESIEDEIPAELAQHKALIAEFWQAKKGSKGETAWNLLIGQLGKIQAKYGSTVCAEQLQLAINAPWQSITLQKMEQFMPKGATAAQAEVRHPASRTGADIQADNEFIARLVAENERKLREQEEIAAGGGVLDGLL